MGLCYIIFFFDQNKGFKDIQNTNTSLGSVSSLDLPPQHHAFSQLLTGPVRLTFHTRDCLKCAPCLLTPPTPSFYRWDQHAHTRLPETFPSRSPFPNNVGGKKRVEKPSFLQTIKRILHKSSNTDKWDSSRPPWWNRTGQCASLSRPGQGPWKVKIPGMQNKITAPFSTFLASSPATLCLGWWPHISACLPSAPTEPGSPALASLHSHARIRAPSSLPGRHPAPWTSTVGAKPLWPGTQFSSPGWEEQPTSCPRHLRPTLHLSHHTPYNPNTSRCLPASLLLQQIQPWCHFLDVHLLDIFLSSSCHCCSDSNDLRASGLKSC